MPGPTHLCGRSARQHASLQPLARFDCDCTATLRLCRTMCSTRSSCRLRCCSTTSAAPVVGGGVELPAAPFATHHRRRGNGGRACPACQPRCHARLRPYLRFVPSCAQFARCSHPRHLKTPATWGTCRPFTYYTSSASIHRPSLARAAAPPWCWLAATAGGGPSEHARPQQHGR